MEETIEVQQPTEEPQTNEQSKPMDMKKLIIIIVCTLVVLIFICIFVIITIVKKNKKKQQVEQADTAIQQHVQRPLMRPQTNPISIENIETTPTNMRNAQKTSIIEQAAAINEAVQSSVKTEPPAEAPEPTKFEPEVNEQKVI